MSICVINLVVCVINWLCVLCRTARAVDYNLSEPRATSSIVIGIILEVQPCPMTIWAAPDRSLERSGRSGLYRAWLLDTASDRAQLIAQFVELDKMVWSLGYV